MIKSFINNKPIVLVLIPIFVTLHMLLDYFFPSFNRMEIGQENLWNINFTLLPDFYSRVLAFLFICVNAILLNFVFNRLEFYNKIIYLPSVLYILLLFLFPISTHFGEDLVGHLFFILFFYKLLCVRQNNDARNSAFLSGFFLGVALTFLPAYSLFLVILFFGLLIIRPFVFREHLAAVIGVLLPQMWVFLVNPDFYKTLFSFQSQINYANLNDILILLPHIAIFLLVIIATKKIFDKRRISSIRFKRVNTITLFTFLFSTVLCVVIFYFYDTYFYFTIGTVILPFILVYAYLDVQQKWLPYSLFYFLLFLNVVKFFV